MGAVRLDVGRVVEQVGAARREAERDERDQRLLEVGPLAEHPGRVLTRHALENKLYAWGDEIASNALEVHIHHLRRKLGQDRILTVRGVGYRLRAA